MKALQETYSYRHFSHHHPLSRTDLPPAAKKTCSGCNRSILPGKDYFHCKACSFSLHQVCYNMPENFQHPAHPHRHLSLHVMPSSPEEGTFNCTACGHQVDGFYYSCAKYVVRYHILCAALPLSLAITCHRHELKLEFSPPYDIHCDLCKDPCFSGWLYTCRICEFDAHLACAISNQRTEAFLPPRASFTRQTSNSLEPLLEATKKADYENEGNELLQLLSQSFMSITESTIQGSDNFAAPGRDKRLNSPKEKLTAKETMTEFNSPNPARQKLDTDKPNLVSGFGDLSSVPSYQFSDGCFSIDLAGSYSVHENNKGLAAGKEASPLDKSAVAEIRETIRVRNNFMLDKITNNFQPAKQERHIKMNVLSVVEEMSQSNSKKSNDFRSRSGIGYQSNKSETAGWKLFRCCS